MKSSLRQYRRTAFTLVELLVSMSLVGVLGGIVYTILNTGLVLFAKNTAINVAHQQARIAVLRVEHNLHSSVSLPKLVDVNRADVAGEGPAAGISFLTFGGGPFRITAPAAAGATSLKVNLRGYEAKPGQRLVIPSHDIEVDVAAGDPGISGNRNILLATGLSLAVETTFDDAGTAVPVDIVCFLADRVTYLVEDGELRYYGPRGANYVVMANAITSPAPFRTPMSGSGTPDARMVTAINLSSADGSTSNRGFKSANIFLNSTVPVRGQLMNSR